jgi:hypothetical protein
MDKKLDRTIIKPALLQASAALMSSEAAASARIHRLPRVFAPCHEQCECELRQV